MERKVFFGNFFHCLSFDESESVLNGFIAVEDGKVINKVLRSFFVIRNMIVCLIINFRSSGLD